MNRKSDSQAPHRTTLLLPRWSLETRVVLLLVAIALVRGVIYALINPPFSSPDEKGHYDYLASMLASGGSDLMGEEKHQPPLYYLLSLPLFAAFAGHGPSISVYGLATGEASLQSLIAVRLVSVLMSVATVPIAYWSARAVFPMDRFVCLGTAAFVALLPAYGWLGASINNDNLATLLTSGMILLMLRGVSQGFSLLQILGLAALIAASLATKPTTLPIVAMVPTVLLARGVSRWISWRQALSAVLILVAGGTVFLLTPARGLLLSPLGAFFKRWGNPDTLSGHGLASFLAKLDPWPFVYQFKSFWGSFADDSIQLPSTLYLLLAVVTAASIIGLVFRLAGALAGGSLAGSITNREKTVGQIAILVGLATLGWMLSFFRFYASEPLGPSGRIAGWEDDFTLLQGRFLFPVIVPIGFLLAWGLGALIPVRMRKYSTLALVTFLIAVDWIALLALAYGGNVWQAYPLGD